MCVCVCVCPTIQQSSSAPPAFTGLFLCESGGLLRTRGGREGKGEGDRKRERERERERDVETERGAVRVEL